MMKLRKKIKNRKETSLLKDKRFLLITISISLGILLVSSNVVLSRKMYTIIQQKSELDKLRTERKDLNEEVETITSPAAIKERAISLGMVEIETIEELLSIGNSN